MTKRTSPLWADAEELEAVTARVMLWPWLAPPERRAVGNLQVISRVARGMGLPVPEVRTNSPYKRWTEAVIRYRSRDDVPPGVLRAFVSIDPSPVVAALMSCWAAASFTGRPVPAELDALVCGGLASGRLNPVKVEVGASWSQVEDMFYGRAVPEEILARAAVELVRQEATRGARSSSKTTNFGLIYGRTPGE